MAKDPRKHSETGGKNAPGQIGQQPSLIKIYDGEELSWKWHPREKLVCELLVWISVVALVYFFEPAFGESWLWDTALMLALVGWIFPVFRLFQLLRLNRNSDALN